MATAYGRDAVLMMRRQADFATAEGAAPPGYVRLPYYESTLGARREQGTDPALPDGRLPSPIDRGLRTADGNLVVPVHLASIGWHLHGLLGAPVTTGAGPYTHTFDAEDADAPVFHSFGISHAKIGVHFGYHGFAYNTLQVTASKQSPRQRMSFGLLGREEVKLGATLDANPTAESADPVAQSWTGEVLKDGAPVGAVTSMEFSYSNGHELDQETITGDENPGGIDEGRIALSGSLTTRFVDAMWYDLAKAGTLFDLAMRWIVGSDSLVLTAHNVQLAEDRVPVQGGGGPISTSWSFQADRPDPGIAPFRAVLVNGRADYAMPV
jgi:hypothetical protein